MSGFAPETLLQQWLPDHQSIVEGVIFAEPFYVPYDQLASIDGWALWLGHPPIPDGLPLLPAPESLLWGEASVAIATALLVAADYAIRRGARDIESARVILNRESPVAIVIPGPLNRSLEPLLTAAETAGLAVIRGEVEHPDELAAMVDAFGMRRAAHAVDLGRPHDPALSFQLPATQVTSGGSALSSFLVHNEPSSRGIQVDRECGPHLGVSIGICGPDVTLEATAELEQVAATIPAFLDGVTSSLIGNTLTLGWGSDNTLQPETLALAFQTWLRALAGADACEIEIEFGIARQSDAELALLRARSNEFHQRRDAALDRAANPTQFEPIANQQLAD